jgi:hypothetical protein
MSMELDRDWCEPYECWIDLIQLTCDFCGNESPWGEPCDIAAGWDHFLGLDCCADCSDEFFASRKNLP